MSFDRSSEVSSASSAASCTDNVATITDLLNSICDQSDIRESRKNIDGLQTVNLGSTNNVKNNVLSYKNWVKWLLVNRKIL